MEHGARLAVKQSEGNVECSSTACWAWPKSGKKELGSCDLGLWLRWGRREMAIGQEREQASELGHLLE
jgi:hypothetical protein